MIRHRHKPLRFEKKSLDDNLEGIVELTHFLPESLELNNITDYLADKKYWIVAARDPETNKEVGSAIWYEVEPGKVEYWLSMVDPAYSGRKLGARLLDLAMGISSQQGYAKIVLTTFNKCKGMLKLCKRRNFLPQGSRKLEVPYGSNDFAIDFEYDFGIDNQRKLSYVVNESSNGKKSNDSLSHGTPLTPPINESCFNEYPL
ncbi:Uncharacterised protein [uncultured archaeon]|nr:Uncharacterised protein [uncultured archaeon]